MKGSCIYLCPHYAIFGSSNRRNVFRFSLFFSFFLSVYFYAEGTGDLYIKAECSNLTQTYSLEDCWIIRNTEQTLTGTSSTITHTLGMDSIGDISSIDFELTFQFKQTNKFGGVINIGPASEWSVSPVKGDYRLSFGSDSQSNTLKSYYCVRTTSTDGGYGTSINSNTYYNMKIVRESGDVKFYLEGTLISTKTQSFWSNYNQFSIYGITWSSSSGLAVKDIKLKKL